MTIINIQSPLPWDEDVLAAGNVQERVQIKLVSMALPAGVYPLRVLTRWLPFKQLIIINR